MTPIYSVHDLPDCRLHVSAVVAEDRAHNAVHIGEMTREKLARQLATTILGMKNVFKAERVGAYLHIDADVVVMTTDEFKSLMQSQFTKGVQHAQGYVPPEDINLTGAKP